MDEHGDEYRQCDQVNDIGLCVESLVAERWVHGGWVIKLTVVSLLGKMEAGRGSRKYRGRVIMRLNERNVRESSDG